MSKKAPTGVVQTSIATDLHVDADLRALSEACSNLGSFMDPFVKRVKTELSRVKDGEQTGTPQIPLLVTERLSLVDVKNIFTAVSFYPYLTKIMLLNCDVKDEGVLVISEFIKSYKPPQDRNPFGVTSLELPRCNITLKGCTYLEKLLAENSTLKTLVLDFNKIGNEGVGHLANGLRWNSSVGRLSLQYCGITSDGGHHVASVLKGSNVSYLSLMGNSLGDKGIALVGRALPLSTKIEELDVADNCLGEIPDGVETLCEGIEKSPTIHSVNLDLNNVGPQGAQAILKATENCTNLTSIKMDERMETEVYRRIMEIIASRSKAPKKKKAK